MYILRFSKINSAHKWSAPPMYFQCVSSGDMGLLPEDRACAENAGNTFPRHRLQRKPLVSDPGMHHGTCGGREKVPGIPGAMCNPQFYLTGKRPMVGYVQDCSNSRALTHWGRVTHICVSKCTIIGSDNGLSPSRRQAIIWTNVGILLIRPSGTNFSENLIGVQTFSFRKMELKMSSAKWRPFVLASMS